MYKTLSSLLRFIISLSLSALASSKIQTIFIFITFHHLFFLDMVSTMYLHYIQIYHFYFFLFFCGDHMVGGEKNGFGHLGEEKKK